jgi:hypothetical protein
MSLASLDGNDLYSWGVIVHVREPSAHDRLQEK